MSKDFSVEADDIKALLIYAYPDESIVKCRRDNGSRQALDRNLAYLFTVEQQHFPPRDEIDFIIYGDNGYHPVARKRELLELSAFLHQEHVVGCD